MRIRNGIRSSNLTREATLMACLFIWAMSVSIIGMTSTHTKLHRDPSQLLESLLPGLSKQDQKKKENDKQTLKQSNKPLTNRQNKYNRTLFFKMMTTTTTTYTTCSRTAADAAATTSTKKYVLLALLLAGAVLIPIILSSLSSLASNNSDTTTTTTTTNLRLLNPSSSSSSRRRRTKVSNSGGGASVAFQHQNEEVIGEKTSKSTYDDDNDLMSKISEKLLQQTTTKKQYPFALIEDDDELVSALPHQFLHLHIMKTGGTSIDHMMECSKNRYEQVMTTMMSSTTTSGKNVSLSYNTIHECKQTQYKQCIDASSLDVGKQCRDTVNDTSILSYCAPLHDLPIFGWGDEEQEKDEQEEESSAATFHSMTSTSSNSNAFQSITILRHPVDRVWSFFKFQPKGCFHCNELLDVYKSIENNTAYEMYDHLCLKQLMNHQTRNLQRRQQHKSEIEVSTLYNDEQVTQAIDSIMNFFTMIGITSQLQETHTLMGIIFPWLNMTLLENSGSVGDGDDITSDIACPLLHENSTPKNNHCMPDGVSHWNLPTTPDKVTFEYIMKYNQMDMKVYEFATRYFELQQRVIHNLSSSDMSSPSPSETTTKTALGGGTSVSATTATLGSNSSGSDHDEDGDDSEDGDRN